MDLITTQMILITAYVILVIVVLYKGIKWQMGWSKNLWTDEQLDEAFIKWQEVTDHE